MTKSGKRELRNEKLAAKWRAFRRDEHGFCGISWLTRRLFVCILFGVCIIVGITLAFTIPRVPAFAFNSNTPLNGSNNVVFSRTPTNFSFDTNLELQVDTTANFLPLHFSQIHVQLFDSDTNKQIGGGALGSKTLPAKTFSTLIFPVTFNYTAINDTDQTCTCPVPQFIWVFEPYFPLTIGLDVYNACRNKQIIPANQSPPRAFIVLLCEQLVIFHLAALKLYIILQMAIVGLIQHPTASTAINSAPCPFELPINSV